MITLNIAKTVTIITPSIGKEELADNMESVKNQTYKHIKHLIVWDGVMPSTVADYEVELPWNVGKEGWYGHRVYAAFSHLLDTDYVCFLDEDNFLQPDHVETLVNTLESDGSYFFAHSLRNIVNEDGDRVLRDNCESLGVYPVWNDPQNRGYHIDTSSYIFHRQYIEQVSHVWHYGYAADRRFLRFAMENQHPFGCTGKYTLNYRLAGNENSAVLDFFKAGNEVMKQAYGDNFPWSKE